MLQKKTNLFEIAILSLIGIDRKTAARMKNMD